jgi:CheY-like chemotaxis protein
VPFRSAAGQSGYLGRNDTSVAAGLDRTIKESGPYAVADRAGTSYAWRAGMALTTSATLPSQPVPRIVLAEDDCTLRELLASALEYEGYEVVQATTGGDLIDRIRRMVASGERVDLVVSDVRMPKMSGLAVLKLMRDAEFDMPVILITAFSDMWTQREAAQYGAVLLDKPVQLRTLREEAEKALSRRAGSRAPRGSSA